ncbi:hypothetical protein PoB_001062000 [Plakobranchus ocellatus]|uniref:Uncharacterized protein n=1 Tax=Plakobranchus ocellatus TaxID=259542 RepID=A0AAV3YNS3_9GAST|nr:hypothetical protein PoB_001062000 [Plakobranchus ocellatus]
MGFWRLTGYLVCPRHLFLVPRITNPLVVVSRAAPVRFPTLIILLEPAYFSGQDEACVLKESVAGFILGNIKGMHNLKSGHLTCVATRLQTRQTNIDSAPHQSARIQPIQQLHPSDSYCGFPQQTKSVLKLVVMIKILWVSTLVLLTVSMKTLPINTGLGKSVSNRFMAFRVLWMTTTCTDFFTVRIVINLTNCLFPYRSGKMLYLCA